MKTIFGQIKRCTKCETWKPVEGFRKQRAAPGGRENTCLQCRKPGGRLRLDLTGQRFERLLVVRAAPDRIGSDGYPRPTWECACDCGASTIVSTSTLRSGGTKSCGCLLGEVSAAAAKARAAALWESVEGAGERECGKCEKTKPLSEFHRRSSGAYYSQCKACHKALTRANWKTKGDEYGATRNAKYEPRPLAELEEREHVVYRFFNRWGHLLYVGITYDFTKRKWLHLRELQEGGKAYDWYAEVDHSRTTIAEYENRSSAKAAETEAIKSELPLFNKEEQATRWRILDHWFSLTSSRA